MPLATVYLISMLDPSSLPSLLDHIRRSTAEPLIVSRPVRWIIRPEHIDPDDLLKPRWDLLLVLEDNPSSKDLLFAFTHHVGIKHHWITKVGIPGRLTKDFVTKTNPSLLHPTSVPELTGALKKPLVQNSSQDLSLSHDLRAWIGASPSNLPVKGAVSMLNLLAFNPDMKSSYLKYGAAFAETIGAKRGGNAKLVGNIIHDSDIAEKQRSSKWDEFALAHYPSLLHFADMLASKDYQEVNQKYRVPALADTCILCTSELEIDELVNGVDESEELKAKL